MENKGKFIVFEGADGTGTTSHAKAIVNWINESKGLAHYTFEPTNSTIGQLLRQRLKLSVNNLDDILKSGAELDALLFAADRMYHWCEIINPLLNQGVNVICDRYYDSSIVYQSLQGANEKWIEVINMFTGIPDMILVFYAQTEEIIRRLQSRNTREKFELPEFIEKVNKKFLQRAIVKGYQTQNTSGEFDIVQQNIRELIISKFEDL